MGSELAPLPRLRGQAVTSAEMCQRNGWEPGDLLRGSEFCGGRAYTITIMLTAIGEEFVMARAIDRDGVVIPATESIWDLTWRDWKRVSGFTAPPSPAAPA